MSILVGFLTADYGFIDGEEVISYPVKANLSDGKNTVAFQVSGGKVFEVFFGDDCRNASRLFNATEVKFKIVSNPKHFDCSAHLISAKSIETVVVDIFFNDKWHDQSN